MNNEVKQAVESIKPLAHGYKAVLVIAEEMEKIGDLDNARFEAERRLAGVRQQFENASKARDVAKEEAQSVRDKATEAFSEAQREAQKLRDKSQAASEARMAQAEQDARHQVAEATKVAQEKVTAAEAEAHGIVEGALKAKADIHALKDQAEAALAGVKAELGARSAELAALEQKLAAAKERAAEMLR
jgi:chromosome segregation ATPase